MTIYTYFYYNTILVKTLHYLLDKSQPLFIQPCRCYLDIDWGYLIVIKGSGQFISFMVDYLNSTHLDSSKRLIHWKLRYWKSLYVAHIYIYLGNNGENIDEGGEGGLGEAIKKEVGETVKN